MKRRITSNFVVFTLGLLLFAGGAYLVYPPAGLIAPGAILMAISLFGGQKL